MVVYNLYHIISITRYVMNSEDFQLLYFAACYLLTENNIEMDMITIIIVDYSTIIIPFLRKVTAAYLLFLETRLAILSFGIKDFMSLTLLSSL